jgi:hypothetical protein
MTSVGASKIHPSLLDCIVMLPVMFDARNQSGGMGAAPDG